ncbi:MAG: hypothetical protein V3U54_08860 [Thermodesulfobacteriota bacterium]
MRPMWGVWKKVIDGRLVGWYVQFPKGIMLYKTKKRALEVAQDHARPAGTIALILLPERIRC